MKQYRKILTVLMMLSCMLLFACVERHLTNQLSSQQLSNRWSGENDYAQISCFFSQDAGLTEAQIIPIERQIATKLQEAAVETEAEGGRTWIDAYSTEGELTISSDRTSATVRTFGVSGDFFWFHPFELLSGNYFDGSDLNEDGVILDEDVAWQLFGSSNVAGMTVDINDITYIIRGVVRNKDGLFGKQAGEEVPTAYVSFGILEGQLLEDESLTIDNYELLIANPVTKFGVTALKEAIGMNESLYDMVENSTRYQFMNQLSVLRNFGVRSMNTKGIIYPYWENRARGYEDIAAFLLVLEFLSLCYPVFFFAGKIRYLWKRKAENKKILKEKLIFAGKKLYAFLKNTVKIKQRFNKHKFHEKTNPDALEFDDAQVQPKKKWFRKAKD